MPLCVWVPYLLGETTHDCHVNTGPVASCEVNRSSQLKTASFIQRLAGIQRGQKTWQEDEKVKLCDGR